MKPEGWTSATRKGRKVTYTCHQRTPQLADITAQVVGKEHFHVQLDVPLPVTHEQVEKRFAATLEEDSGRQPPSSG
jgi:hypothetical protein